MENTSSQDATGSKQLTKNLRIISKIILVNLRDDPLYFALQAARRVDSKFLSRVAFLATRYVPNRTPTIKAFFLLLSGNSERLSKHLLAVDLSKTSDKTLARLSDMAIAVQDSESAKQLLENADLSTAALARSKARHAWYLGEMQQAIEILTIVVKPTNKQLRHYKSELEVFRGSLPTVDAGSSLGDYTAQRNTALHFLTNSLPHTGSGYAQRSHSSMMALQSTGWFVEVMTRAGYPLTVGNLRAKSVDVVDGIKYSRIIPNKYRSDMKSKIQQQADALARKVVALRPEVLHTTTDFSNALAVMSVAKAYGIPWVYEVRGQLADTWASSRPESAKASERYRLFKEREAFVASQADLVITLGNAMKEELVRQGVNPDKIQLSPNAVGGEYLDVPLDRRTAQESLGLDPTLQYVGTVSSLVAYEGLDLLVRAIAELAPTNPRLRLLIVGSGVEANNLEDLSQRLGVGDRCIFPGRVPREQARTYHSALNVFVVPRRDLTVTQAVTPLKPVEALACEVPVVAADLPALRELIEDGITGLLVPAEHVEQLVNSIQTLLDDPSKSASMGAIGRQKVLAERTWEANAKKLSMAYKNVVDNTALNG